MEQTLVIVKPDAVARGLIGEVIRRFEAEGLVVCGLKMVGLAQKEAEGFYQVHQHQPFFDSLTRFMASSPCVVMVLEGKGRYGAFGRSWAPLIHSRPTRGRCGEALPPALRRTLCMAPTRRHQRPLKSRTFSADWRSFPWSEGGKYLWRKLESTAVLSGNSLTWEYPTCRMRLDLTEYLQCWWSGHRYLQKG